MNVVFYSTNSNYFDENTYFINNFPSNFQKINSFIKNHPQDNISFLTQKPGMFILDAVTEKVDFIQILETDETNQIVKIIKELKPDIVFALSFWVTPYDWLNIKDSLIAEELNQIGIRTVCHNLETSLICFDKYKTYNFLRENNFLTPKSIYVNHDLYFCAGNRREIKYNVYKESILKLIKKMNFPLIIKDNVGLSSYGMQIINTYEQAVNYLNSKKHSSDRIVQEYIKGLNFGLEIYGYNNQYQILNPFIFSINQYGITSPKQSIKIGPVFNDFNISTLKVEVERLAKKMNFNGCAQIDLIYSQEENKWYFLEINPRLSGMTNTYAINTDSNIYELFYNVFINNQKLNQHNCVINFKTKILLKEQIDSLLKYSFVKNICQTEDKNAKQDREMGFCEIILSDQSFCNLQKDLTVMYNAHPDFFEESFYKKSLEMLDKM